MKRKGQTEKQFHALVVQLAKLCGWAVYHTRDSRRSDFGWPDLVLCRPPRILFVEVKTEAGEVKPEQAAWLALLTGCGLDARLWRPGSWPEIQRTLTGEDQ